MRGVIYHDLIVEKLEIARSLGILARYLVNPTGTGHRSDDMVNVWSTATTSHAVLKDYLMGLLEGLVADHEITISGNAPLAEGTAPGTPAGEAGWKPVPALA